MLDYTLSTPIPTFSKSKGLIASPEFIFSNNTYLFKYTDKLNFIATIDNEILDIKFFNRGYLILSHNRVWYLNEIGKIICTFKKEVLAFETMDNYIYVAYGSALEKYSIQNINNTSEFKFCLENRSKAHSEEIYFLKNIDGIIFSASNDRCIRLNYNNKSIIVSNQRYKVLNICIKSEDPFILCIITEKSIFDQKINCFNFKSKNFLEVERNFEVLSKDFYDEKIFSGTFFNERTILTFKKHFLIVENNVKNSYPIEDSFIELSCNSENLFLKNENGIKIFNWKEKDLKFFIDFPKVNCISQCKNLLIVGNGDDKVRIYDHNLMIGSFLDPKIVGKIFFVKKIKKIIYCVTNVGHVSLFDMKNSVCFKSFTINCKVSSCCLSEDGSLLFLSDFYTNEILVIDLMRCKVVDTINNGFPILKMIWWKSFLYALSVDSLVKFDLYNSDSTSYPINGNSLALGSSLGVCCDSKVVMFDENLNVINTIEYFLRGRNRSEKFNKPKPITKITFDHLNNVIIGGQSNSIIMLNNTESRKYLATHNKTLENFKEFLGKEDDRVFDSNRIIDVLDLIHSENSPVFYVLTKQTLVCYKFNDQKLKLTSSFTIEDLSNYIAKNDNYNALMCSLQLNQTEQTKNIIRNFHFEIDYTLNLTSKLMNLIVEMIYKKDSLDFSILWLKSLLIRNFKLNDESKLKVRRILCEIKERGWEYYKKLAN